MVKEEDLALQAGPRKDQEEWSGAKLSVDGSLFSEPGPIRRFVLSLTSYAEFEWFVLALIFGNCAELACWDPRQNVHEGRNAILFWLDLSFTLAFTAEILLRIIVVSETLEHFWWYWKDPWNIFDVAMVALGYTIFADGSNSSAIRAIRALRALRPLRTIVKVESLRLVVEALLAAVPSMSSILILLFLVLYGYSTVGIAIFNSVYNQMCESDADGTLEQQYNDPDEFGCGAWRQCPANYTCTTFEDSTAVNTAGFENIGRALLAVYQVISATGWSFIMYRCADSVSPFASYPFFISLSLIGTYFCINLLIAALKLRFAKHAGDGGEAEAEAAEHALELAELDAIIEDMHMQGHLAHAATTTDFSKHDTASYPSTPPSPLLQQASRKFDKGATSEVGDQQHDRVPPQPSDDGGDERWHKPPEITSPTAGSNVTYNSLYSPRLFPAAAQPPNNFDQAGDTKEDISLVPAADGSIRPGDLSSARRSPFSTAPGEGAALRQALHDSSFAAWDNALGVLGINQHGSTASMLSSTTLEGSPRAGVQPSAHTQVRSINAAAEQLVGTGTAVPAAGEVAGDAGLRLSRASSPLRSEDGTAAQASLTRGSPPLGRKSLGGSRLATTVTASSLEQPLPERQRPSEPGHLPPGSPSLTAVGAKQSSMARRAQQVQEEELLPRKMRVSWGQLPSGDPAAASRSPSQSGTAMQRLPSPLLRPSLLGVQDGSSQAQLEAKATTISDLSQPEDSSTPRGTPPSQAFTRLHSMTSRAVPNLGASAGNVQEYPAVAKMPLPVGVAMGKSFSAAAQGSRAGSMKSAMSFSATTSRQPRGNAQGNALPGTWTQRPTRLGSITGVAGLHGLVQGSHGSGAGLPLHLLALQHHQLPSMSGKSFTSSQRPGTEAVRAGVFGGYVSAARRPKQSLALNLAKSAVSGLRTASVTITEIVASRRASAATYVADDALHTGSPTSVLGIVQLPTAAGTTGQSGQEQQKDSNVAKQAANTPTLVLDSTVAAHRIQSGRPAAAGAYRASERRFLTVEDILQLWCKQHEESSTPVVIGDQPHPLQVAKASEECHSPARVNPHHGSDDVEQGRKEAGIPEGDEEAGSHPASPRSPARVSTSTMMQRYQSQRRSNQQQQQHESGRRRTSLTGILDPDQSLHRLTHTRTFSGRVTSTRKSTSLERNTHTALQGVDEEVGYVDSEAQPELLPELLSAQEFDHVLRQVVRHPELIPGTSTPGWLGQRFLQLQFRLRGLLSHPWFETATLTCSFASAVLLAIEYEGMNDTLQMNLVKANYPFLLLVVLEALLKITAYGLQQFIMLQRGWAVFDLIMASLAAGEFVGELIGGLEAIRYNYGLVVVRALRVVRTLKSLQLMPGPAELLGILVASAPKFVSIAILVILFWIVFAIVGMNAFGDFNLDLTYLAYDGYPNFSTFIGSLVISFQVMVLENYQQTMMSTIRAAGWASSLWFVIWILLGKYTFLSLFLAVTLEAFDGYQPPPEANYTGVPWRVRLRWQLRQLRDRWDALMTCTYMPTRQEVEPHNPGAEGDPKNDQAAAHNHDPHSSSYSSDHEGEDVSSEDANMSVYSHRMGGAPAGATGMQQGGNAGLDTGHQQRNRQAQPQPQQPTSDPSMYVPDPRPEGFLFSGGSSTARLSPFSRPNNLTVAGRAPSGLLNSSSKSPVLSGVLGGQDALHRSFTAQLDGPPVRRQISGTAGTRMAISRASTQTTGLQAPNAPASAAFLHSRQLPAQQQPFLPQVQAARLHSYTATAPPLMPGPVRGLPPSGASQTVQSQPPQQAQSPWATMDTRVTKRRASLDLSALSSQATLDLLAAMAAAQFQANNAPGRPQAQAEPGRSPDFSVHYSGYSRSGTVAFGPPQVPPQGAGRARRASYSVPSPHMPTRFGQGPLMAQGGTRLQHMGSLPRSGSSLPVSAPPGMVPRPRRAAATVTSGNDEVENGCGPPQPPPAPLPPAPAPTPPLAPEADSLRAAEEEPPAERQQQQHQQQHSRSHLLLAQHQAAQPAGSHMSEALRGSDAGRDDFMLPMPLSPAVRQASAAASLMQASATADDLISDLAEPDKAGGGAPRSPRQHSRPGASSINISSGYSDTSERSGRPPGIGSGYTSVTSARLAAARDGSSVSRAGSTRRVMFADEVAAAGGAVCATTSISRSQSRSALVAPPPTAIASNLMVDEGVLGTPFLYAALEQRTQGQQQQQEPEVEPGSRGSAGGCAGAAIAQPPVDVNDIMPELSLRPGSAAAASSRRASVVTIGAEGSPAVKPQRSPLASHRSAALPGGGSDSDRSPRSPALRGHLSTGATLQPENAGRRSGSVLLIPGARSQELQSRGASSGSFSLGGHHSLRQPSPPLLRNSPLIKRDRAGSSPAATSSLAGTSPAPSTPSLRGVFPAGGSSPAGGGGAGPSPLSANAGAVMGLKRTSATEGTGVAAASQQEPGAPKPPRTMHRLRGSSLALNETPVQQRIVPPMFKRAQPLLARRSGNLQSQTSAPVHAAVANQAAAEQGSSLEDDTARSDDDDEAHNTRSSPVHEGPPGGPGDPAPEAGPLHSSHAGAPHGPHGAAPPMLKRMSRSLRSMAAGSNTSSWDQSNPTSLPGSLIIDETGHARVQGADANARHDISWQLPLEGHSLFVLGPDSRFRQVVWAIVDHELFEYTMLVIIMACCVFLAIENPLTDRHSIQGQIVYWADVFFTTIFTIEAILKIIAWRFTSYIVQGQNIVDFIVVVASITELLFHNLRFFHALRPLRALRAIRVMTKSDGLRHVLQAVWTAVVKLGSVSFVCLLFTFVFAIMGCALFKGRFWQCRNPDGNVVTHGIDPSTGEVVRVQGEGDCSSLLDPGGSGDYLSWENAYPNFDNLGNTLITLLVACTTNGWTPAMVQSMSGPSVPGDASVLNQNWAAFFFWVAFVMSCALILINLYTGAIFGQFNRISAEAAGSAFMTPAQRQWVAIQEAVFRLKPLNSKRVVPKNRLRYAIFHLLHHRYFMYTSYTIICLNCVTLTLEHWGASRGFSSFMWGANVAFTVAIGVEVALKVTGLGFRLFLKNTWNKLDLLILALSITSLCVNFFWATVLRMMAIFSAERLLRILRLGRLLEAHRGLKMLWLVFISCLPSFANIGGLIFVVFFAWAYLGVQLFGTLQPGYMLNYHGNFMTWPNAMVVMVRTATADNWSDIMVEIIPQREPRDTCDPNDSRPCSSWLIIPYYAIFVIVVFFILINLFMAVIIEAYERHAEMVDWDLAPHMLDEFVWSWVEYDFEGKGTIEPRYFGHVLRDTAPPLGLGPDASDEVVAAFVDHLDLPVINGRLHFKRTLFELARRCCECELPDSAIKQHIERLHNRHFGYINRIVTAANTNINNTSGSLVREASGDPSVIKQQQGRVSIQGGVISNDGSLHRTTRPRSSLSGRPDQHPPSAGPMAPARAPSPLQRTPSPPTPVHPHAQGMSFDGAAPGLTRAPTAPESGGADSAQAPHYRSEPGSCLTSDPLRAQSTELSALQTPPASASGAPVAVPAGGRRIRRNSLTILSNAAAELATSMATSLLSSNKPDPNQPVTLSVLRGSALDFSDSGVVASSKRLAPPPVSLAPAGQSMSGLATRPSGTGQNGGSESRRASGLLAVQSLMLHPQGSALLAAALQDYAAGTSSRRASGGLVSRQASVLGLLGAGESRARRASALGITRTASTFLPNPYSSSSLVPGGISGSGVPSGAQRRRSALGLTHVASTVGLAALQAAEGFDNIPMFMPTAPRAPRAQRMLAAQQRRSATLQTQHSIAEDSPFLGGLQDGLSPAADSSVSLFRRPSGVTSNRAAARGSAPGQPEQGDNSAASLNRLGATGLSHPLYNKTGSTDGRSALAGAGTSHYAVQESQQQQGSLSGASGSGIYGSGAQHLGRSPSKTASGRSAAPQMPAVMPPAQLQSSASPTQRLVSVPGTSAGTVSAGEVAAQTAEVSNTAPPRALPPPGSPEAKAAARHVWSVTKSALTLVTGTILRGQRRAGAAAGAGGGVSPTSTSPAGQAAAGADGTGYTPRSSLQGPERQASSVAGGSSAAAADSAPEPGGLTGGLRVSVNGSGSGPLRSSLASAPGRSSLKGAGSASNNSRRRVRLSIPGTEGLAVAPGFSHAASGGDEWGGQDRGPGSELNTVEQPGPGKGDREVTVSSLQLPSIKPAPPAPGARVLPTPPDTRFAAAALVPPTLTAAGGVTADKAASDPLPPQDSPVVQEPNKSGLPLITAMSSGRMASGATGATPLARAAAARARASLDAKHGANLALATDSQAAAGGALASTSHSAAPGSYAEVWEEVEEFGDDEEYEMDPLPLVAALMNNQDQAPGGGQHLPASTPLQVLREESAEGQEGLLLQGQQQQQQQLAPGGASGGRPSPPQGRHAAGGRRFSFEQSRSSRPSSGPEMHHRHTGGDEAGGSDGERRSRDSEASAGGLGGLFSRLFMFDRNSPRGSRSMHERHSSPRAGGGSPRSGAAGATQRGPSASGGSSGRLQPRHPSGRWGAGPAAGLLRTRSHHHSPRSDADECDEGKMSHRVGTANRATFAGHTDRSTSPHEHTLPGAPLPPSAAFARSRSARHSRNSRFSAAGPGGASALESMSLRVGGTVGEADEVYIASAAVSPASGKSFSAKAGGLLVRALTRGRRGEEDEASGSSSSPHGGGGGEEARTSTRHSRHQLNEEVMVVERAHSSRFNFVEGAQAKHTLSMSHQLATQAMVERSRKSVARIDRLASQGNLGALAAIVAAEHQAMFAMHQGSLRRTGPHGDEDDE